MSYILDALRRADSERERGTVPGVRAQPVPLGSNDADPASRSRMLIWVSVGLAALLLASLAWQWFGRDTPAEAAPSAAALPAPPPPIPVTEAAPAPVPAPAPQPVASAVVAPVPARAPAVAVIHKPAAPPAAASRPASSPPRTAPVQAAASAAIKAETPVLSASELPEEIRRTLPTLTVGGASYSQNPVNRMLIINGQVFREGDQLAPDVSLEQIRLKEAVLTTKGYRYRITY